MLCIEQNKKKTKQKTKKKKKQKTNLTTQSECICYENEKRTPSDTSCFTIS